MPQSGIIEAPRYISYGICPGAFRPIRPYGDNTAKLQALINASAGTGIPIDGYSQKYFVKTLNIPSNVSLRNFYFETLGGTDDFISPITIGSYNDDTLKENISLENIHINGNRTNQDSIGASEDGGRHGFRIIGYVKNVLIKDSSAKYCASDGISIYSGINTRPVAFSPDDPLAYSIRVVNSEFSWNRRHGGSGDSLKTADFINCKFNDNGQDIGGSVADGAFGMNIANGFDTEGYGIGSQVGNIRFLSCEAVRNKRHGFLFYDPVDSADPDFIQRQYFNLTGCSSDKGNGGTNNFGIEFVCAVGFELNPIKLYNHIDIISCTSPDPSNFVSCDNVTVA